MNRSRRRAPHPRSGIDRVARLLQTLPLVLLSLVVAIGATTTVDRTVDLPIRRIGNEPFTVMPLGDSNTDGANIPGGYRIPLKTLMNNAGRSTDFVGSMSNGPLTDREHEGHNGYRIDEIHFGRPGVDSGVNQWLPVYQPREILLMIGTNDVLQNHAVADADDRLRALVQRIFELRPDAEVFLATIPPTRHDCSLLRCDAQIATFNAAIPSIVNQFAAQGRLIWFVDNSDVTKSDISNDFIHPNGTGYSKIADNFWEQLGPRLAARSRVHVGGLTGSSSWQNKSRWRASATVTVLDASNKPVPGTVAALTTNSGSSGSCTTGVTGRCTVTTTQSRTRTSVTYSVVNLTYPSAAYDPGANTSSSIFIARPA